MEMQSVSVLQSILRRLFHWKPLADVHDVKVRSLDLFCKTSQSALGVYLCMPLEPPDQQHWQAAAGYVELGMFLEADTELDKIDPFNRAAPEV
jgi:hypothetical protein